MAEAKLCRLNNNWNGPRWGQIVGVLCVPWLELFTATTHSLPWEYTSAIVASVLAVAFNGILSQCTHSNTPPVNGVAEGFDARQRWRWRRGMSVVNVLSATGVMLVLLPVLGGRHVERDLDRFILSYVPITITPFMFNMLLYVLLFITQYVFVVQHASRSFTVSELIIAAQLVSRAVVTQTRVLLDWNLDRILGVSIPQVLSEHYEHVLAYGTVGLVIAILAHALLLLPFPLTLSSARSPSTSSSTRPPPPPPPPTWARVRRQLVPIAAGVATIAVLVYLLFEYSIAVLFIQVQVGVLSLARWWPAFRGRWVVSWMVIVFATTVSFLLVSFLSSTAILAVVFVSILYREWSLLVYWISIAVGFALIFATMALVTTALESQSLNTIIRKLFHAMALAMFIPALFWKPVLLRFCFGAAILIFVALEYIRFSGRALHVASRAQVATAGMHRVPKAQQRNSMSSELWLLFRVHRIIADILTRAIAFVSNSRDTAGPLTVSHIYLLVGCSLPLLLLHPWSHPLSITVYTSGLVMLGVADSMASIIGSRCGRNKWTTTSRKSIEGTLAAVVTSVVTHMGLIYVHNTTISVMSSAPIEWVDAAMLVAATTVTCLVEAFTEHLDNLVLPPIFVTCLLYIVSLRS